jgi:hypothetical protein
MLKHLIILANLTLVFGYSGTRKEKLKWDVMYTPETCPIKVQYGDMALIYFNIYKKLDGVDGYDSNPFVFEGGFDMPSYFEKVEMTREESQKGKEGAKVTVTRGQYPLHVRRSTAFKVKTKGNLETFWIRGIEQAILGMCMGEKRTLYIPGHMTYDKTKSSGGAVKLELDVYKVEPGLRTIEEFSLFDLDNDGKLDEDEFENYLNKESVDLFFRKHPYAERRPDDDFQSLNLKRSSGKNMFKRKDANQDKLLSFEEFKTFGSEERHHWDKTWDLRTREGQEELHGKKEKDE